MEVQRAINEPKLLTNIKEKSDGNKSQIGLAFPVHLFTDTDYCFPQGKLPSSKDLISIIHHSILSIQHRAGR